VPVEGGFAVRVGQPATPLLETQTEESLGERERTQRQAEKTEAGRRREEEQRAQADADVGDFRLSGSDSQADVAVGYGQEDLLAQAASDTDTNPTDGQKEADNYKKGKIWIQGL
jgi:hypothetical protein